MCVHCKCMQVVANSVAYMLQKRLWSSANYQLQHTHTHTDRHTAVQSTLHDRGRFGCMQTHAHTYIIAMYVCAQGKEKTKQNTSERQTITIACARTSWLRRLCCYCAVDVLLMLRCSCCWPCQQVGARAFGFGKVINFQLSLFVCLLFLA